MFAYTPVEDPAVYLNVFRPFTDHLTKCTGKRVVYYPVQSNSAQIEAMRSGRLHIAGFSTGPTGFAVNLAGAVPFAIKGTEKELQGYNLIALVRASSPFQKLSDLKGKRVAHTSPSSNSGNLAPRVLFPPEGLTPDTDYRPLMSGGHDKSALGVASGDYDMAPVASDVYTRMVTRGTITGADIRIIYTSPLFPTSSFTYAHDLKPELAGQDQGVLLQLPLHAGDGARNSTATTASSRSTIWSTGRWCGTSRKRPARRSTRRPMMPKRSARPRRAPRPSKRPRNSFASACP